MTSSLPFAAAQATQRITMTDSRGTSAGDERRPPSHCGGGDLYVRTTGEKRGWEKWCSFPFGRHCGPEGGKTPRTREGPFLCFSIGFGGRHAELEAPQAMFLFFFLPPSFFCCTGKKHRAGVSRMRCAVFFSSPFFTSFVTSPSPALGSHISSSPLFGTFSSSG